MHSELVTEDMGAVRFSEVLRRVMNERYKGFTFAKITGDPAGDVRAQTDEVTPFQILRKAGIPAQPAATNDFIKRRESVAGALSGGTLSLKNPLTHNLECLDGFRYFFRS